MDSLSLEQEGVGLEAAREGEKEKGNGVDFLTDGCSVEAPAACPDEPGDDEEACPDELTCAICLEQIAPMELAIVKGCEHLYHANCILQWAVYKEVSSCPQCKSPFSYLFCHRLLDGTPVDFPVEESVTLLKRAKWFQEYVKTSEKGQALAASMAPEEIEGADYYEEEEETEEEYLEEEEYLLRGAGTSRVLIGNRRWGQGGFMRSGRMYARPVQQPPSPAQPPGGGIGKAGKGKALAATAKGGDAAAGSSSASSAPDEEGGPSDASTSKGSSKGAAQGRRAKRNARRNAVDGQNHTIPGM